MHERSQHRRLYKQIPEFECIEGCIDCCGPVPLSIYEARRLGIDMPITPINKQCKCLFISDKGCSVYNKRPLVCRLFGAGLKTTMMCPHGKKPKTMLSRDQERKIFQEYKKFEFPESLSDLLAEINQGVADAKG